MKRFLLTCAATLAAVGAAGAWVQGPEDAETSKVSQKNRVFHPGDVTIRRGDTLSFINDDDTGHHVMNRQGMTIAFSSDLIKPGDSYEHMFDETGKFKITCAIHPLMELNVNVVENGERKVASADRR